MTSVYASFEPNVQADRYSIRQYQAFLFLSVIQLLAVLLSQIQDFDIIFLFSSVVFMAIAVVMRFTRAAPHTTFLVLHPVILYQSTTVLYALFDGNISIAGMYDKSTSSYILLCYQLSIFAAFIIANPLRAASVATRDVVVRYIAVRRLHIYYTLFILLYAFSQSEVGGMLKATNILWLSLAFYVHGRLIDFNAGGGGSKYLFLFGFTVVAMSSLYINQRAGIFISILCLGVIFVYSVERFKYKQLIYAFMLVFAVNLATNSFQSARYELNNGVSQSNAALLTLARMVDLETIAASVPLFGADIERNLTYSQISNLNYSELLASNGAEQEFSVFSRLALLARMDIVTGRLGMAWSPGGSDIPALFASALPDYGQVKRLIYSDEIIWRLSLIPTGVVGRPLVTIPGELYSAGGVSGMLIAVFFSYVGIFAFIRVINAISPSALGKMLVVLVSAYNVTFTGTAVDLFVLVMRNLPLLCLMILMIEKTIGLKPGRLLTGASPNLKKVSG